MRAVACCIEIFLVPILTPYKATLQKTTQQTIPSQKTSSHRHSRATPTRPVGAELETWLATTPSALRLRALLKTSRAHHNQRLQAPNTTAEEAQPTSSVMTHLHRARATKPNTTTMLLQRVSWARARISCISWERNKLFLPNAAVSISCVSLESFNCGFCLLTFCISQYTQGVFGYSR